MERTFTFPAQLVWRCCFMRCFRERAFTYPVNDFLDTVGHAGSHGLSIVFHARLGRRSHMLHSCSRDSLGALIPCGQRSYCSMKFSWFIYDLDLLDSVASCFMGHVIRLACLVTDEETHRVSVIVQVCLIQETDVANMDVLGIHSVQK